MSIQSDYGEKGVQVSMFLTMDNQFLLVIHHGVIGAPILKQKHPQPPQIEIWLLNKLDPMATFLNQTMLCLNVCTGVIYSVQMEATSSLLLDYLVVIRPWNYTKALNFPITILAFILNSNLYIYSSRRTYVLFWETIPNFHRIN